MKPKNLRLISFFILTLFLFQLIFATPIMRVKAQTNNGIAVVYKSFGGKKWDQFFGVSVTPDGGCIAVGSSNSADRDMAGLNKGDFDAIIVRYDSKGNIKWKKGFGGSGLDKFEGVAVTPDGGCIAVGASSSSDGDMAGLNKDDFDAIVVKYDSKGNIKWKKSFGGDSLDQFFGVAITPDGGCIAVGFSASDDEDMLGLSKGDSDAIIVKYNKEGKLEWKKSFGGSNRDFFNEVAVTPDGGCIAVGYSESNDRDMAGLSKGDIDAIIVKYNKEGKIKWKKSFGGSKVDYFFGVSVTPDGGCIAVGSSNSADGDMVGLNKDDFDAIIVRYDSKGNIKWKKGFGGSKVDYFCGVAVTPDRGCTAVGFSTSDGGDMTGLNKGDSDAMIVKYNIEGKMEWKKSFGGSSGDYFNEVAITPDGGYIAVGYSYSNDGDMAGLNKGDRDAIIVKISKQIKVIKVNGVKLNKTNITLKEGAKDKLIATVIPSNATNRGVTWTSSNSKVVKVDSNGNLTALDKGTATITVRTVDGGYKATCKVVVK
ncbi:Ig-like domain-containing protein [Caldicellulosiruptor morganii]|uniref:Ig-like domain-containing protein n=1 Tax=Caldicellulosiruptor morganii TaxID=1387555 RepID=A0ABY7BM44_9FIRM|nr:Ig-like domain-containing protein [Caldicellulosiruptor morganii]WAM33575.1 Ig-like domain-containing protein [Caldicellulosiruptor morganii]